MDRLEDQDLRVLRILGAALISGPTMFLGVAIYLRNNADLPFPENPGQTVITWASLFVCVAVIATSLLLPRPKGGDMGKIRAHFIVRLALVEAGALFGTVAYLIEGETFGLGVAVLCLAVMAMLHFPTADRVERLRTSRE